MTFATEARAEAIRYLTRRWEDQCEQFPLMRKEIPCELYVRRNLKYLLTWRQRQALTTGD